MTDKPLPSLVDDLAWKVARMLNHGKFKGFVPTPDHDWDAAFNALERLRQLAHDNYEGDEDYVVHFHEDKDGAWVCSRCDLGWDSWVGSLPSDHCINYCPSCGGLIVSELSFEHADGVRKEDNDEV